MITKDNYHLVSRISKRTTPILKSENRFTKVLKRTSKDDETNLLIKSKLLSGESFMAARYGSIESRAIVNYKVKQKNLYDYEAIWKTIIGDINIYWKHDDKFLKDLVTNAGFFPENENALKDFVTLMENCTEQLDILGVWNGYEEYFHVPETTTLCKIRELEPWFYDIPWSCALEGKNVLVIHPFEDSIKKQYHNREKLYKNEKILPQFTLKTIKAVQTIAGEVSNFKTWFEALDFMKRQIDDCDFDVAIIGCGAYGFPLAAYIKQIGKSAIHLGGVTQLLFGIKGKRWEEWEHYTKLRKNHGNAWIFAKEKPVNYNKIENGCYW